ncbi:hypothetical protein FXO38_18832 [Capsicum annuum]|nr:hypothetical protein FXO38_18832 [Capsicum annuum]KAF3652370.1 hypothetical protein FXO37_17547 [Capsicum annuum]
MGGTDTHGEDHNTLHHGGGPTSCTSDRGYSMDGPNNQRGDRQNSQGTGPPTLGSNMATSANIGDLKQHELQRVQLPSEPHVQESTMLTQYSLPIRTGDTNVCPLEPSNSLRLSPVDHTNSFDLNHSVSPTVSSGHSTGRRLRRNKTNHSRGT